MHPLIVKRDSKLELYDPNKIARVSKAAGLTDEQAQKLVDTLSKWLHSLGLEQLHSSKLRQQVIAEMEKLNKNASQMFDWYEKTKDNNK